jgi:hypothetical protein
MGAFIRAIIVNKDFETESLGREHFVVVGWYDDTDR